MGVNIQKKNPIRKDFLTACISYVLLPASTSAFPQQRSPKTPAGFHENATFQVGSFFTVESICV